MSFGWALGSDAAVYEAQPPLDGPNRHRARFFQGPNRSSEKNASSKESSKRTSFQSHFRMITEVRRGTSISWEHAGIESRVLSRGVHNDSTESSTGRGMTPPIVELDTFISHESIRCGSLALSTCYSLSTPQFFQLEWPVIDHKTGSRLNILSYIIFVNGALTARYKVI